jgi:hypothetical protein
MRHAGDPLHLQAHLIKQQVWESGVKGRSSFYESSYGMQQEECHCGMLLFTADYPDYVNMPCFP